ncbi:MAG: hypothetical protein WD066_08705 [Planctomycetaceae bacterium]
MNRISRWMSLMLLTGAFGSIAVAADADEATSPAPPAARADSPDAAPERIAGWIADLSSDEFEARVEAARRLQDAGRPAIAPIAEAALAGDFDRAMRCVGILERLHGSEEPATKEAARAALEKLSQSEHKPVAARAETILRPPAPPQNAFPQVAGGAIRIRINGAAQGVGRKIQVSIANGARTIDVEEGGRKVHIEDADGKDIAIRIEEPDENGKAQSREVKAKDVEELKKKDAAAAEIYEKYTSDGGPIRIFGGAGGIRINARPAIVPPPQLPVEPAPKE